jgi:endonuclease/exonuclease/phosphatase family metal-dependent hydrolase
MKILYLNINSGINDFFGIVDFIKNDFDIICLQEIHKDIELEIDKTLTNYNYSGIKKEIENIGDFYLKTYVKNTYEKINFEVYDSEESLTAPSILLKIERGNSKWNILNFHGTPFPGTKVDTDYRIEASKNLINLMKNLEGHKIIGGDFNLLPETQSVKIFEEEGFRNLITEYKIPTTRNKNSWNLYPGNKQYFADYIFISKDLNVKSFTVTNNEISDHLPLTLEI